MDHVEYHRKPVGDAPAHISRFAAPFAALLVLAGFIASPATAGPMGYPAGARAKSSAPDPCRSRYRNIVVPSSPYRQHEDSRRYNAAPCTPPASRPASEVHRPVLLETEELSRRRVPRVFYDRKGRKHRVTATVITYRDLYSDGTCRTREKTYAGKGK